MVNKVDWFIKAIRVSSAWNPIATVFLQLQSEINGIEINRRLDSLEDPISSKCENATELCRAIYNHLKQSDEALNGINYIQFARPLAFFESEGYLKRQLQMGSPYAYGIESLDSTFILYLARLFDSPTNMSELFSIIEDCNAGEWIDGIQLAEALDVPEAVVRSAFDLYVNKGYGIISNENNTCKYRGIA
jgi:hypothetical protein